MSNSFIYSLLMLVRDDVVLWAYSYIYLNIRLVLTHWKVVGKLRKLHGFIFLIQSKWIVRPAIFSTRVKAFLVCTSALWYKLNPNHDVGIMR